ncbi:MAG TPA: competence/damage-inducible protein A, partial [Armatimonadota bacterium]
MHAEVLSIGTELLLGQITDTNAVYIAQRLAEVGVSLYYKSTVGDNPDRLAEVLTLARERSDLLICTGGLGPTEDDITAAGVARAFDEPLVLDEESARTLEEFFRQRGRPMTENQLKQAHIPRGARAIPNPVGTAPGFLLEKAGKTVIVMPGPPHEMHTMWRDTIGPYLRERSDAVIVSRTLRFCGIGEGALEMLLKDLIDAQTNPTIAPYAKLAEVHIRVTARTTSEEAAWQLIEPTVAAIRERAGQYLYGADDETLEVVAGRMLKERGLTLAVAESCTGGLLGGRITNVAGSSEYFPGGVISYSNALKEMMLDVPAETLNTHGAVSEETARAMAQGIARATGSHYGISVTGVAGPGGGTEEKPVGLVYIGIADRKGKSLVQRNSMWGDRATIRNRSVQQALVLLR